MSFGLNRVELIGRLGADVTVNHLASGGRVANLSIATDESYIDRNGTGERVDKTEWHRVVTFQDGLIDMLERHAKKGRLVHAEGNRHADLLFNIVSSRSQQNSTIITTNRPFAEWGEAFPNAACLVALVDRLVHNAEILAIDGDSYRRKEAGERQKQRNAERRRRRAAKGGRSAEKAAADPGTS